MNLFDQVFREFIELLNKYDVEYILIGGYAVNIYGYTRGTGDLDIWINGTKENGDKIKLVIHEFGYDADELESIDFEQIIMFHFGERPAQIEITNRITGLNFTEAYKNIKVIEFEGLKLKLIHLNDLKVNKLLSGRYKDLDDLENLEKINP